MMSNWNANFIWRPQIKLVILFNEEIYSAFNKNIN